MSPRRKRFFRLLALALLPALLVLLEVALRLFGFGYRTGFFDTVRVGGQEFRVANENFSRRFFPPELARWPGPIRMPAAKPADTIRIFILGESAAMGDPEPAFGAGRYLEALLRERFPGQKFEIINTAITAINANVILPVARDCARQQGDLWILYLGNNEMVGPFGAATVFGARAPPLPLIRLNLAIQRTRVGQGLSSLARQLKGKSPNASWGGMRMFLGNQVRPDDPGKETVYRNFQRNLEDIVRLGLKAKAGIILSTVAVNLGDCPPFASLASSNLPAADQSACNRNFAEGTDAMQRGDLDAAVKRFGEAARLDPQRADVAFRLGECLLRLNRFDQAREQFQLACDHDALPFRADSRINRLIRQTGGRWAGDRLVLLDAEAALASRSPAGICGREFFHEHVHFNFDGNYVLARAWAGSVESLLPAAIRDRAAGEWATQATCERRLALTDWSRYFVLQSVLRRLDQPPLDTQWNSARRREDLQSRLNGLRPLMDGDDDYAAARALYEGAIRRAPEDHYLHEGFGEFLQARGDLPGAVARWRRVRELVPEDNLARFQLSRLLGKQGQWKEAESLLRGVLTQRPAFAEAWFELGNVRFGEGRFEPALEAYDRARQLQPEDPRPYCQMGRALSLLKRSAESIENFRHAIRVRPDYWEAHYALGGELGAHEKIAEAKAEFETVVRLQPQFAMGHLNLGVAMLKLGRPDEALRQFEETLRLDPENKLARDYLGQVLALKSRAASQSRIGATTNAP